MYQAINKMVSNYLSSKFIPTILVHQYNLRGSGSELFVPRLSTEYGKPYRTKGGRVRVFRSRKNVDQEIRVPN